MLSLLLAFSLQASAEVPRTNCDMAWQLALDVAPRGEGPLRPLGLHCHRGIGFTYGRFDPLFSPDGRWIALLFGSDPEGMLRIFEAGRIDPPAAYDTGAGVLMEFAGVRSVPFVAWSADSRFVWAARQTRMRPGGGWALTPLRPVRVFTDGRAEDLPELRHPAGSLDGLLWAGHRGLAVAQFGTRGGMYRPERENRRPTFAIVDAAQGRVRDSLPIAAIWPMLGVTRGEPSIYGFRHVFAAEQPDGRIRVLFITRNAWIVWTEGEAPRRIAAATDLLYATVASDGRRLLVLRPVPPASEAGEGIVITSCGPPRHGPCPPRAPRERVWAALYDAETGARLWQIRRAFDVRDPYDPTPAISPDGRYALIGLEPDENRVREAALVSLRDGRILQTIPASPNHYSLGFTWHGRIVWLNAQSHTVLYAVD